MVVSRSAARSAALAKIKSDAIEAKKIMRQKKKELLQQIYDECDIARNNSNNNKVPYGFFTTTLKQVNAGSDCPFDISLNAIKKGYKRHVLKVATSAINDCAEVSNRTNGGVPLPITSPGSTPEKEQRSKGGRPTGTTNRNKYEVKLCNIAAKNEITVRYAAAIEKRKKDEKKVRKRSAPEYC